MMEEKVGLGIPEFKLDDLLPMPPDMGPPLPRVLGLLWPWGVIPGAEFKASDLVISPQEVTPGQVVTIACTVTNIGTETGDYTVKLGGDFMVEQTVTLEPGESKTISFIVTPDRVKTYSVTVDGLSGSFRATEVPAADIRVENLIISPSEVYAGETVTISVVATNYGGVAGTKRIVCTVS